MSLRTRIALLFNVKTAAALDAVEDPREVLDYAYSQQRAQLRQLKRGRIEIAAARRLLEQQATALREQAARSHDQARRALRADREDLARAALERRQTSQTELEEVERQLAHLRREEARLAHADQQLALRVERFRLHRTVRSAQYTAAEAQVTAAGLVEGLEPDLHVELGLAVERAEDKIERLAARAVVIDSVTESGALLTLPGEDPIEQQLHAITASDAIEAELNALRRELGAQSAQADPQPTAAEEPPRAEPDQPAAEGEQP